MYLIRIIGRIVLHALLECVHKTVDNRATEIHTAQNGNWPIDAVLQFGKMQRVQSNGELADASPSWSHDNIDELNRVRGVLANQVRVTLHKWHMVECLRLNRITIDKSP